MILYWLNAQASHATQAWESFVFGVISFSHRGWSKILIQ